MRGSEAAVAGAGQTGADREGSRRNEDAAAATMFGQIRLMLGLD